MKMTITIPDEVHKKLVGLKERTNIPLSTLIAMGIEYLDGKEYLNSMFTHNEERFAGLLREAEREAALQLTTPFYKDYEVVHLPTLIKRGENGLIEATSTVYSPINYNGILLKELEEKESTKDAASKEPEESTE